MCIFRFSWIRLCPLWLPLEIFRTQNHVPAPARLPACPPSHLASKFCLYSPCFACSLAFFSLRSFSPSLSLPLSFSISGLSAVFALCLSLIPFPRRSDAQGRFVVHFPA